MTKSVNAQLIEKLTKARDTLIDAEMLLLSDHTGRRHYIQQAHGLVSTIRADLMFRPVK